MRLKVTFTLLLLIIWINIRGEWDRTLFETLVAKIHHNSIWYKVVFGRQYLSSFTDNEAPGQIFSSPLQFQITPQPLTMTWQKTTSDMPLAYHVAAVFQQQPSLIPPLSQYKILNCLLVNYLSSLLCLVSGKLYVWYSEKKSERKNDFNCNALSNCTTWNNLSVQQVVQKCPLIDKWNGQSWMRQMKKD